MKKKKKKKKKLIAYLFFLKKSENTIQDRSNCEIGFNDGKMMNRFLPASGRCSSQFPTRIFSLVIFRSCTTLPEEPKSRFVLTKLLDIPEEKNLVEKLKNKIYSYPKALSQFRQTTRTVLQERNKFFISPAEARNYRVWKKDIFKLIAPIVISGFFPLYIPFILVGYYYCPHWKPTAFITEIQRVFYSNFIFIFVF